GYTWRLMRLISEMFRFVPLCSVMAPGKSVDSMDGFFSMLTEQQCQSIQVVGIDRSNAYKAAVEKYLPHAAICFDHFHIISNLNDALDQVRREELHKASEMNRRLISNSRYLLLKGRENVAEDKVNRLNQLLLSNRKISDGYVLKEQFREIYKAKDVNGGIWRLSEWLRMTRASSIEPLKRFAKGLLKNFNEVINFFKFRISSGKIEAANASISRIQAKTCGLFNIPYLFLKLRQSFYQ
ncbi:MAG: transposase, partial [Akkermansia sp.]